MLWLQKVNIAVIYSQDMIFDDDTIRLSFFRPFRNFSDKPRSLRHHIFMTQMVAFYSLELHFEFSYNLGNTEKVFHKNALDHLKLKLPLQFLNAPS